MYQISFTNTINKNVGICSKVGVVFFQSKSYENINKNQKRINNKIKEAKYEDIKSNGKGKKAIHKLELTRTVNGRLLASNTKGKRSN